MASRFVSFFALYFGLGFASPLLITLANREDLAFSLLSFSIASLLLVLALSAVSSFLAFKTPFARSLSIASLACAFVFALQGNFVHDLFYYGDFNGSLTDWREYGWKFWAEWFGFLFAFPLFYWLLSRLKQIPVWLALVPVLSSVLLIAPVLFNQQANVALAVSDEVNPDVFEFSSTLNLIHLLPDGFQGDIAREVLDDHPELSARLEGFILYRDHLGMYQGTAPSVPTIFTGRPFDFKAGYNVERTIDEMKLYAYPVSLQENGFRLDYVTLSTAYCVEGAASCINRSFNDLKARGYFRHKDEHYSYAARQLADLTLFRHLPMYLKEKIYNGGNWFFADTTLDGSSPWPDPVLREWIDNMVVSGPQPRYKWYHYIGTHIPPRWDAECVFNHELERTRKQYYDQSLCVLRGIARFAEKLREHGIFDKTAIIISGDHGVNIKPDDNLGRKPNSGLHAGVIGAARPTLMIKPLRAQEAFQVSDLPTSLIDIAPTALDLVGLDNNYSGQSVLTIDPELERTRIFNRYTSAEFWTGESISNEIWHIDGTSRDMENWSFQDLIYKHLAPAGYAAVNFNSARNTARGLSFNRATPDVESSWISGSEFVILVGTEQPQLAASIELELSLPDFMKAATQSFSVAVNHQDLEDTYSLDNNKEWSLITIPLPDGVLTQGNNQLVLKFSETAAPENRTDDWHAAGKLRSFRLVQ